MSEQNEAVNNPNYKYGASILARRKFPDNIGQCHTIVKKTVVTGKKAFIAGFLYKSMDRQCVSRNKRIAMPFFNGPSH